MVASSRMATVVHPSTCSMRAPVAQLLRPSGLMPAHPFLRNCVSIDLPGHGGNPVVGQPPDSGLPGSLNHPHCRLGCAVPRQTDLPHASRKRQRCGLYQCFFKRPQNIKLLEASSGICDRVQEMALVVRAYPIRKRINISGTTALQIDPWHPAFRPQPCQCVPVAMAQANGLIAIRACGATQRCRDGSTDLPVFFGPGSPSPARSGPIHVTQIHRIVAKLPHWPAKIQLNHDS